MSRTITAGRLRQGADETVYYELDTANWGGSPTSVSAKVFSYADNAYTDVTSTKMVGSANVTGDVITLPGITALAEGTLYRVEVKFTSGANVFEPYFEIMGER